MNIRGDLNDFVGAIVMLFVALLTFYVVMVIWDPITNQLLFPLLNNTEAFTYGPTAVTLFQVMVLVAVAAIFLAFFNQARGERRPPIAFQG